MESHEVNEMETADPDWEDTDKARKKYYLKDFSEDFMRNVVEYVDETRKSSAKRRRSRKSIHHDLELFPISPTSVCFGNIS
ncbi:unnamed protein product [Didymodactylos carnosus]|uniref:Uncharacterized protein n=1 Tax=Didymodactylos carnosus TaxID=1234261 RepID=A0A814UTL3_9BILA|nr:unnamed protein product [Didymodactylos carnosus]CAF1179429.1 unnamed protein product [Didymodactylos carnosus]CAF3720900.1 unnamed protein product [Didymodactylos carnosus]CAF3943634.1 unnamed protein product [Didymodactylos carnosus]